MTCDGHPPEGEGSIFRVDDVLRIVDLTVRLGAEVVIDKVGLTARTGEATGLIGASGAGKTTLALAVLGLLPVNARVTGSITVSGVEVVGAHERELRRLRGRRVALVGQDALAGLNPVVRIGRQLLIPLRRHRGLSGPVLTRAAVESLDEVELPARILRAYPAQLSGGQRQRVMIALAMACRPALLIADEPTSALDTTTRVGVLTLLGALPQQQPGPDGRRTSLLLISHDIAAVRRTCTRLVVLDRGRIVEAGPVEQVLRAPRSAATRRLLDAVTRSPARPSEPVRDGPAESDWNER